MYISEYCDVRYLEDKNVVFVTWKKFCCYDDYCRPLQYALDIISQHHCDIDESNSLKDELEGQESDSENIMEFRYIYSIEDIPTCK